MKNKKLLVGILSASGIAITLPAIASCSKHNNVNEPEVSSSTPKTRAVGARATRTYFYITQSNIESPEDTTVKMVNLKVNGADAKPVSGLIKYVNDSAGNILVIFNMSLAIAQYQADTITFDLLLKNKTANTEYTVPDFTVTVTDQSSAVTYNVEQCPGIIWSQNPDTVTVGESLDIQFKLEAGYEWLSPDEVLDVTIDGTSIREDLKTLEENHEALGKHYWYFDEDEQMCYINVPPEEIAANSDIQVTLKSQGKSYDIEKTITDITTDLPDKIQHGQGWKEFSFAGPAYYEIKDSSWDIKDANDESLKPNNAKYDASTKKIKINTDAVFSNLKVTGTASKKDFHITMATSTHLQGFDVTKTYGSGDQTITITARTGMERKFKPLKELNYSYIDSEEGGDPKTGKIVSTNDDGVYTIPESIIKGNITITPDDEGCLYHVYSTDVKDHATFTGEATTRYAESGNYTATLKPEDVYYELNTTWDVQRYDYQTSTYKSIKSSVTLQDDTLSVPSNLIIGDLKVSATAKGKSWDVTPTWPDDSRYTTTTLSQATYGQDTDYTAEITVDDQYFTYSLDKTSMKCKCHDIKTDTDIDIAEKVSLVTTSDPLKLKLTIAKEAILGPISLTFKQDANQYAVDASGVGENLTFTGTTGQKAATRRVPYEATLTPATYYQVDTLTIKSGTTTLTKDDDYTYTNNELVIKGTSIVGDITITATAKLQEYDVDVSGTTGGLTFTAPAQKPQHGVAYSITYALTDGKKLNTSSVKCVVTGGETLTIDNGLTLTATSAEQKITITDPNKIVGKLTFTGAGADISVTEDATGIDSVSGTAKYLQETTLTLAMTTGYSLHVDDFTNEDVVVYNGSTKIDHTKISVNTGDSTITIAAGIVTDDIKISGTVKHYTASAKIKSGSESIITGLTFNKVATYNTEYSVTFATASGYLTPTATVKVAGTTLPTTDYTITTTGITIPATKVTGAIEITDITALEELKWADTFEATVMQNSTSTYAYSAIAQAGTGTPSVSIKAGTEKTGVSLNSDKKIVVDSTATVGDEVTLQATLDGAQTIEATVKVTEELKELTLSGTTHMLDIDTSSATSTITVKYGEETVAATDCDWSVSEGNSVTVTDGVVSINTSATDGGYAKVKCAYPKQSNAQATAEFEIEVASYNKVYVMSMTSSTACVRGADSKPSGKFVIPSMYYSGTTRYTITEIYNNGFNSSGIYCTSVTGLVLPNTIKTICDDAFAYHTLTSLTIPASVETLEARVFQQKYDSAGTATHLTSVTFASGSALKTIGKSAFGNCRLVSITIPSTCTSIGEVVFYENSTLTSVNFDDQSNWYKLDESGQPTGTELDVSNDTDNATNLKYNGDWYWYGLVKQSS